MAERAFGVMKWARKVFLLLGMSSCVAGAEIVDVDGNVLGNEAALWDIDVEQTTIQDVKDRVSPGLNVYYAVCDTAAGTGSSTSPKMAQLIPDDSGFVLSTGVVVVVRFTNQNTVESPYLKVGPTDAKTIVRYGTTAVLGTSPYAWKAGEAVPFVYDGARWEMLKPAEATTSYAGVVQLSTATNSTSTALAATPSAVKAVRDEVGNKADKPDEFLAGNLTEFDTYGNSKDSGYSVSNLIVSANEKSRSYADTKTFVVSSDEVEYGSGFAHYAVCGDGSRKYAAYAPKMRGNFIATDVTGSFASDFITASLNLDDLSRTVVAVRNYITTDYTGFGAIDVTYTIPVNNVYDWSADSIQVKCTKNVLGYSSITEVYVPSMSGDGWEFYPSSSYFSGGTVTGTLWVDDSSSSVEFTIALNETSGADYEMVVFGTASRYLLETEVDSKRSKSMVRTGLDGELGSGPGIKIYDFTDDTRHWQLSVPRLNVALSGTDGQAYEFNSNTDPYLYLPLVNLKAGTAKWPYYSSYYDNDHNKYKYSINSPLVPNQSALLAAYTAATNQLNQQGIRVQTYHIRVPMLACPLRHAFNTLIHKRVVKTGGNSTVNHDVTFDVGILPFNEDHLDYGDYMVSLIADCTSTNSTGWHSVYPEQQNPSEIVFGYTNIVNTTESLNQNYRLYDFEFLFPNSWMNDGQGHFVFVPDSNTVTFNIRYKWDYDTNVYYQNVDTGVQHVMSEEIMPMHFSQTGLVQTLTVTLTRPLSQTETIVSPAEKVITTSNNNLWYDEQQKATWGIFVTNGCFYSEIISLKDYRKETVK